MSFNSYKYLLLLISFISIFSSEIKFKNSNSSIESNETNLNNTNHTKKEKPKTDKNRPLNMTIDEMDTLMFCTILTQETVKKDRIEIEKIVKKINLTSANPVYDKVGTDIYELCVNKSDIKLVNVYIKNLTYFDNYQWDNKFNELVNIDYSKYENITDLYLTPQQRILMYKYQRVDEIFRQKRADNREFYEKESNKIKIGKFDLDSIPGYVKGLVFFAIFGLFFGGLFYLLKSVEKKPKDKKDKKKKKTQ